MRILCGMRNGDDVYFAEYLMWKKTCGMWYNLRNKKMRKVHDNARDQDITKSKFFPSEMNVG